MKALNFLCWAYLTAAVIAGVWALATATPPHLVCL